MSTRCKPIKAIGDVNVLAPSTNSPYYRLTWIEPTAAMDAPAVAGP